MATKKKTKEKKPKPEVEAPIVTPEPEPKPEPETSKPEEPKVEAPVVEKPIAGLTQAELISDARTIIDLLVKAMDSRFDRHTARRLAREFLERF